MRLGVLLLLCSCLPRAHDVTGHPCQQDSDCGSGFVCWKSTCAVAGSVAAVPVQGGPLALGNDEGGAPATAVSVRRQPPAFGLGSWDAGAPLPFARSQLASAQMGGRIYLVGGGDDGGSPAPDVSSVVLGTSGALAGWTSESALPSGRRGHAAVGYGGWLYALGGLGVQGELLDSVVAANVGVDGTLGAWAPLGTLPSARSQFAAVASGGYVYAVGGAGGTGLLADVLAAPVRADGTLGPWAVAGSLPQGRSGLGAVAYQGWLYVVGGTCGGAACGALGARLDGHGTLGAWSALPDLAAPRSALSVVAWAGALYAIGGAHSDGTTVGDVEGAPINADGSIGAWAPFSSLPAARSGLASAAGSGALFALGGTDGTAAQPSVFTAPVLQNTTVAPWLANNDLQPGGSSVAFAVYDGALYVMGGDLDNGPNALPLQTIERGVVGRDGTIASWVDAGMLAKPLASAGAAAWNDRLYVVGGCTGIDYCQTFLTDTEVATFRPDGTVGGFVSTTPLPDIRLGEGVLAYRGNLYAIGGTSAYTDVADVFVARIDPVTGLLGPWQTAAPMPNTVGHAATAAVNGRVYALGGRFPDGGFSDQAWVGSVDPAGLITLWTATTPLPAHRTAAEAVAVDFNLYVIGGCNDDLNQTYCGNVLDEVLVAPIHDDGTLGSWSSTHPMLTPRHSHAVGTLGRWLVAANGRSPNAPTGTVESTRLGAPGDLGVWTPGASLPAPRESHGAAALGDRLFVAGGAGPSSSVVWATLDGGSIAAWSSGPALPAARSELALVSAGGSLIASGGDDGSGNGAADVWVSDGTAPWTSAPSLPQGVRGHASAAFAGHIYAVGGVNSANVYVAELSDGGLSPWRTTQALPAPRSSHATVAYDGFLYVVAGQSGDAGLGDVLVAPIDSQGNLGNWARTASLPAARESVAAAAQSGYLYVTGGHRPDLDPSLGSSSFVSEVQVAAIRADGSLGEFTPAFALPAPLEHHAAAIAGGALHVLGGRSSAATAGVFSAVLGTPPALGRYSVQVDLGSTVTSLDSLSLAGSPASLGTFSLDFRTAGSDGLFSDWAHAGPLPLGLDTPLAVPAVRYVWLQLVLDELTTGTLDLAAVNRDITGMTLSIHR